MVTEFLLIAIYVLFRYVRANKTPVFFAGSLFFTAMAIYEARNNILLFIILLLWVCILIFIAYLKESGNEWIKELQKGYKPLEHILLAGIFVVIFLLVFLTRKLVFK